MLLLLLALPLRPRAHTHTHPAVCVRTQGSFANSPGHSRGMEVPCLQLEFSPGNTYIAAVYQGQPLHILDGMELNEASQQRQCP